MNLVIVPFHDWRKILLEGSRTRDSHFIEEFKKRQDKIIIVNRPTTLVEIGLKRKLNLITGKVIYSKNNFRLLEISENTYLIDYISYDIIGQITQKYKWFIKKYGDNAFVDFINKSLEILGVNQDYNLLNQNIFASNLSEKLTPKKSVFDAWDNFMKFDVYNDIKDEIKKNYHQYAEICDFWITNSEDNVLEYKNLYKVGEINLITNGVDVSRFIGNANSIPEDLSKIKRPIVGFGGKITHLLDVDLINETIKNSPEISFVFVGQILDNQIFDAIVKQPNFYYLGDKHYDVYPDYVKNFDICTVPYIVDEHKKSGANTIKVYEYLATNKKVVGTLSNGLESLKDHVYIVKEASDFATELKDQDNHKLQINLNLHSWETKTNSVVDLMKS